MKVAHFKMDGGAVTDLPSPMIPANAWTSVSNYNFGINGTRGYGVIANRITGATADWTTPAACEPRWAMECALPVTSGSRATTTYRWYVGPIYGGTTARIGQQLAGVDTNVTPGGFAATAWGKVTGGLLNNLVPFINGQSRPPLYWDAIGGTGWNVLPNIRAATSTYNAMRAFKGYLIGIGYQDTTTLPESDTVHWSVAAAYNAPPTTWVPAATNEAGDVILPGGGECTDGAELGQDFIIYKKDASYRMTYIGGNYVFGFRPLFKGWGCYQPNCVVEDAGKHYVFTGNDLIVHDGVQWQSILSGKIKTALTLGTSYPENAFLSIDRYNRVLYLCLTQATLQWPTAALTVDLDSLNCSARTFGNGISQIVHDNRTSRGTLIGVYPGTGSASSGRFFNLLSGTQWNGSTNITASIAKNRFDMGSPHTVKTVKWVRPHIVDAVTASTQVTVEVAGMMTADATETFGTAQTYTTGTSDGCPVHAVGRYLSFRFGSTGNHGQYGIAGFSVGYEETSATAY